MVTIHKFHQLMDILYMRINDINIIKEYEFIPIIHTRKTWIRFNKRIGLYIMIHLYYIKYIFLNSI
jgi:hypothetical protein